MSTLLDQDGMRRFLALDVEFTEYNTRRALRLTDGEFERRSFGGAVAVRDRTQDESYYNRVIGLREEELGLLDEMVSFHHEVGRPCSVALTSDRVTPTIQRELQRRGFEPAGECTFFAAHLPSSQLAAPEITVRRAVPDDLEVVAALWAEDSGEPIEPAVLARRAQAQWVPEFPIYLAELEGHVAAMATTYLHAGIAFLANANTFRRFRQRGCQLALIRQRMLDAAELGCEWAMSDTSDGSISHRNLERAGMRVSHVETTLSLSLGAIVRP